MHILAVRDTADYRATFAEYPGDMRQSWHSHDEAIVTMILAGQVREGVGRHEQSAGPMEIGIKPAGIPHTDHFGPRPLRAVRIAVPTAGAATGNPLTVLQQWTWRTSPMACRALCGAANALMHRDEDAVDGHVWDALAGLASSPVPVHAGNPPTWLRQAHDHLLDAGGTAPLRALALTAGVHPVHFAAQFRRYYGCSTSEFRQNHRVQRATGLVCRSRIPLSQIAAMLGYADQAHFTRQFRKVIGVSPGRFRLLTSGSPPFDHSRRSREVS